MINEKIMGGDGMIRKLKDRPIITIADKSKVEHQNETTELFNIIDLIKKEVSNSMFYSVGYYEITNGESNFLISYNTMIKPSVGDDVKIKDKIYNVKSVCIDYDKGNIHAFIKKK